MKKMDDNGDNQISKEEFYNALLNAGKFPSGKEIPSNKDKYSVAAAIIEEEQRVDQALAKIKAGASKFPSLKEYVAHMMKKMDVNKDGFISFTEMADGLREMGIKVFKGEQAAMMRRLDEDRDGRIAYDELLRALQKVA